MVLDEVEFAYVETATDPPWGGGPFEGRGWLCTLTLDGRSMEIMFWQGSAHVDDPTLEDVWECIVMDCRIVEDDDLDGIVTTFKQAKACIDQRDQFLTLLGSQEAYESALEEGANA